MPSVPSRLLRQGLVRATLVGNAYRPRLRSRTLTIPSFFAGWLTTEAAPLVTAAWGLTTLQALRRREGRLTGADKVGLALSAASVVGMAGLVREALRSGEQLDAALAPEVPADELADAPRAMRAGAVLPVLVGNRRRSITRNIAYATPDGHRLRLDVYEPLGEARTGERLGLIETRLGALEDLARQQTSALADLAAALKPLHTAIEGLASIQRADVELQKRKLEHEEGAPRRMELAGKMALELMKAGGALLLAAAGGVAALWAAFKGSP